MNRCAGCTSNFGSNPTVTDSRQCRPIFCCSTCLNDFYENYPAKDAAPEPDLDVADALTVEMAGASMEIHGITAPDPMTLVDALRWKCKNLEEQVSGLKGLGILNEHQLDRRAVRIVELEEERMRDTAIEEH